MASVSAASSRREAAEHHGHEERGHLIIGHLARRVVGDQASPILGRRSRFPSRLCWISDGISIRSHLRERSLACSPSLHCRRSCSRPSPRRLGADGGGPCAMGVAAIEARPRDRAGPLQGRPRARLHRLCRQLARPRLVALLDEGELIPDSLRSSERDSLYARAEVLARRAVAADSMRPEGHFAVAATVGRAALTMGKKERIRRAKIVREEALAPWPWIPDPRRGLPRSGPVERGDHAAVRVQPLLRQELPRRGHLRRGVVGRGDHEPTEGRELDPDGSTIGWSSPASTPTASGTRRRSTSWGGSRPCRTGSCRSALPSGPWSVPAEQIAGKH